MKLSGWKFAVAALVILAALAIMINVSSHTAQAAPAPGQIFIDLNGNTTYDPGTETLYLSIQAAIDDSSVGSTVVVGAGTYTEQLFMNWSIDLVGASMTNTTISCPATLTTQPSIVSILGGARVNFTGFTVSGPGTSLGMGLYVIGGSYVHVWDCTFSDIRHDPVDTSLSPTCIKLGNATGTPRSGTGLIENCTFNNWQKAAIRVDSVGSYAEVRNCTIQGWSTSSTLIAQVGVYVINHANAWVHDNTISQIGGSSSGRGIMLENGGNALIEHNNLTGINTVGDLAIGVYLLNSGPSVIIQNNRMTQWAWGAYVSTTVLGPRFENNTFILNRGSGLQLSNAQNTSILYNNFIRNGLPTGGNGLIITAGSANSSAHYNNFMGNNYGLFAGTINPFNATLNYWNSFSGPSGSGLGTGDEVHETVGNPVSWNPWLKSAYPPAVPLSGIGGKSVVDEFTMFDLSGSAGLSVQLNGSGTPLVTAFRYSQNPVDEFEGISLERYFDMRINTSTGVTQLTVTLYYNQTDVPAGMNESELRLYWWNGTHWTAVTDSVVDPIANLIIAEFRPDTQPSLGQLVGTAFLGGAPRVSLAPSSGPSGTLITVQGRGFFPFSSVTMKFADNLVATGFASWRGAVTIQGLAPYAVAGDYRVSLVDTLGCIGSSSFSVLDGTALDIQVSVGSLHFRGELATFWASTSLNGVPVDVDNLTALLYNPAFGVLNLNVSHVTTGIYSMNFTVPLNAQFGDYAFVVTATYGSHSGVGLSGGQISETLTGFNARLIGIEANIATIQTDLGGIRVDLSLMNIHLVSIDGSMAVLQTEVGLIRADLVTIGATLTGMNGSLALIQTDLGLLLVNVSAIDARLISIEGTLATVQTTLGTMQVNLTSIQATLVSIEGSLATVQTTLGRVDLNVTAVHAQLVTIEGAIATVQTTLGRVDLNVTAVNAHLVAIDGTLASIQTSLGAIQISLAAIDARIIALQGTVARINTTCGALTVSLAALDAKVVQVQGSLVTIQTTLGTIDGQIIDLQGTTATIQTDLGTVSADVKDAQNNSNNNSTTIIVLLILIMVILIGMYFWKLRKVL